MKEIIYDNQTIIYSDSLGDDCKKYLCVVMPAFNEGAHIKENLLYASKVVSGFVKNYQLVVVNDGSSDNTLEQIMLAVAEDSAISVVSYTDNKGKGYAIKTGVHFSNANYIAFLDSDMELDPGMLRYFIRSLKVSNADIAIGSKLHRKSKLNYPLSRRVMSVGYYLLLKCMFKLNLKDTQTGIKLFRAEVIKPICESLETYGYAYDIEILAKATKDNRSIIELPIELNYRRDQRETSRFPIKQLCRIFKETLKVRKAVR